MAADRLSFLDPVALRTIYPSALHNEFLFRSPSNPFSNVQFIPERVSQFSISPDGVRYYKVHWQDTWLAEHQLLPYQNLIESFWRNQNDLATTTAQTSSSLPTSNDIIKPRKEPAPNHGESFLNVLQNDSVDLSATTVHTVLVSKADNPVSSHSSVSSHNLIPFQTVHAGKVETAISTLTPIVRTQTTDILKEAVISSDLVNGMDVALPSTDDVPVTVEPSSQGSLSNSTKYLSPGPIKRSSKSRTIQLEGFDLINIENTIATEEELEAQARETLGSFRRKRVRFPNGTSKLPQTCFFCLKTISNRKKLREHQFGVHFKNVGEFFCGICQQRFVFRRQLKAHMITHSDNRNYVCKICGLTCKRRSHLHKHMDTHKKERNYRCDVCHKNFKVQAELKDHCLGEHKNEVSQCNVCKQTLHTPFSVYIHSMRHSGTRDHICDTCGRSFKRKQHLIAHETIHNADLKDKIKCPACDKEFPERQYFRKHLEAYHKELAETYRNGYVCEICNKDFAYKGRLDTHMKLHENETEEQREARSKKGKVDMISEEMLENLKDKIEKVVDEKTGFVVMRCKLCTKREFRMISSMERHLQEHENGRVFMKTTGTYECEVCKKSFHSEARLIRHGAVHQAKQKQHQCRRCKKFFKWKSCLQAHAKKCQPSNKVQPPNKAQLPAINKGAEKRKATLKAKEKLRKTLRKIQQSNDYDYDSDSDTSSIELDFKKTTRSRGDEVRKEKDDRKENEKIVLKFKIHPKLNENDESTSEIIVDKNTDIPMANDNESICLPNSITQTTSISINHTTPLPNTPPVELETPQNFNNFETSSFTSPTESNDSNSENTAITLTAQSLAAIGAHNMVILPAIENHESSATEALSLVSNSKVYTSHNFNTSTIPIVSNPATPIDPVTTEESLLLPSYSMNTTVSDGKISVTLPPLIHNAMEDSHPGTVDE